MRDLVVSDDAVARDLARKYGGIVRLNGLFGLNKYDLLVSDPAALHHLFLSSAGGWDLSDHLLSSFKGLFGPGVAAVQGSDHARQRRIMSRALNPSENTHMLPAVQLTGQKVCRGQLRAGPLAYRAVQLVERIVSYCSTSGFAQLDALYWTRRAALDSLTRFAFGVDMASLDSDAKAKATLDAFESMLYVSLSRCHESTLTRTV